MGAKPAYAENIERLLTYVQDTPNAIDLKGTNEKEELVHGEIITKIPNATETDKLLFNEFMYMITGDLAMTRYIPLNVKNSGLAIWRKLRKTNDTNTYTIKEIYKMPYLAIA